MENFLDKSIIILGASELQVPAIVAAKKNNIRSIVVDYDPDATGRYLADEFYEISTLDYNSILELAITKNVDGIMTLCSDRPMKVVAMVGERLGLNTISVETAIAATSKAEMRKALAAEEVPIPGFCIVDSKHEFCNAIEQFAMPFIVKPSDNSGSRGITLVDDKTYALEAYYYAKKNAMDGIVLVEEYMSGDEVSVEVFVEKENIHIIQITDKLTTGAPHFVEMGHLQPSKLDEASKNDICKVARAAVKALKINTGPAHVEIKFTDKGAKIVEVGSRLGGDFITTDLVPLSTGIDMVEATLLDALGEDVNLQKTKSRMAAIRYFSFNRYINFSNDVISNLERAYVNKMEKHEIESSRDREGFFIVSGDSFDEIEEKIEKVNNSIL